jgi:hypothetical protein
MEVSYRDIIRETKNAINARLDMLESMISMNTNNVNDSIRETITNQSVEIEDLKSNLYRVSESISNILNRITIMERNAAPSMPSPYEPMPELRVDNDVKVITIEEEEEVEEVEEVEEEESSPELEESSLELEESSPELEESSLELEEFEYKGMTLYRDPENKVYRMDEEGALSEPLGIWDDAKQKIKKIV